MDEVKFSEARAIKLELEEMERILALVGASRTNIIAFKSSFDGSPREDIEAPILIELVLNQDNANFKAVHGALGIIRDYYSSEVDRLKLKFKAL